MTETETTVKSGGADKELRVSKVTVSDTAQVEASAPVVPSGISLKEASDADFNAESCATVLVKVTEEASTLNREMAGDKVDVTDEHNKEVMLEKEEGRKEATITQEKGSTHSYVKPSSTVLVKVEEQASTVILVEDKAGEEDSNEQAVQGEAVDERPKSGALNNPARRIRKRKKVSSASVGTSAAASKYSEDKTSVAHNVEDALSKEEHGKELVLNEEDNANQAMKTSTASIAVAVETANDDSVKETGADTDKVGRSLNKKNKKRRKRKRNKFQVTEAEAAETAEVGADKKLSVEKQHAGMIFMCSSETKMDCYRYKVFGMPAGKKETVANIYKGMKLFLYDIDLKLLYGIYVATSKGGYNIQPKAFNSAFPAQVRFKVHKDCLPLPEERFKIAIKANYYKKKKFRLELTAEQVKNLSKLFVDGTKVSKRANGRAASERVPQDYASRDTGRKRFKGMVGRPLADKDVRMFPRSVTTHEMEESRVPRRGAPFPPHGSGFPGQAPLLPPPYSSPPRHPPLPPPAYYTYERPATDANYYHGELPMEAYGYRAANSEVPLGHVLQNNPYYHLRREPAQYSDTLDAAPLPWGYRDPAAPYRY